MKANVLAAEVAKVAASREPHAVNALFRQALTEVLPDGTVQPRWIADRELIGVFEGYGSVRDFADWCDATGADPGFEFGPPPEVVLYARHLLAGHVVHVECVADQHDVEPWFRLNPSGLL
ncbi:hypothetical protein J2S68_003551 [Glycomyces algeriensis]|uniref:Uncharacterized protein n=1 Tax=Glycomyces algeriensis TaxID=256037 RepID=A0A9W6GD87_9ACTN|nr:hypothetical protein [Glycomyces algeriensis]MDR7352008.1 hypothetical protein [Glycomyces algeriensis]GLI44740.1 hypothetical protein GALLR39Z86_45900 [Glycomyces algeriensis]